MRPAGKRAVPPVPGSRCAGPWATGWKICCTSPCRRPWTGPVPAGVPGFPDYYLAHCNEETRPYRGIPELLEALEKLGVKTAIVSNKAHPAVLALRDRYFPKTMQVAIGESREVRRKPAPDTVFRALEELGIPREEAVYVGDSEVDKMTADNAGMDCFLVTWGFRDRDELAALRPTSLIDSPEQILEQVKG